MPALIGGIALLQTHFNLRKPIEIRRRQKWRGHIVIHVGWRFRQFEIEFGITGKQGDSKPLDGDGGDGILGSSLEVDACQSG